MWSAWWTGTFAAFGVIKADRDMTIMFGVVDDMPFGTSLCAFFTHGSSSTTLSSFLCHFACSFRPITASRSNFAETSFRVLPECRSVRRHAGSRFLRAISRRVPSACRRSSRSLNQKILNLILTLPNVFLRQGMIAAAPLRLNTLKKTRRVKVKIKTTKVPS